MPMKKNQVKENDKIVVIEDYNGQKALWDGKNEASKVAWKIRSPEIGKLCTTADFLRKFTAGNYLEACSVLTLSQDKHYTSVEKDSILESLFQGDVEIKTVRLFLKYDSSKVSPTDGDGLRVPLSKNFALHIKDKDRKAVLWNGKQFVYKMKLNLTDEEMFSSSLETLLRKHAPLHYLTKNCKASLLSPKYENTLTPVSVMDFVGSFVNDSSATIYLQNFKDCTKNKNTINKNKGKMTKSESEFEVVPMPSCSSMEMIDIEEVNSLNQGGKKLKKSVTPKPKNIVQSADPWKKSNWTAIKSLIMGLERDSLITMGYRHVPEEDRRKLVTELWALNKAFKNKKRCAADVHSHFKALEAVVINNHPGSTNAKLYSNNVKLFDYQQKHYFEDECQPKNSYYSNEKQYSFMKNSKNKSKNTKPIKIRPSHYVEILQQESAQASFAAASHIDYKNNGEPCVPSSSPPKERGFKCPDCLTDLLCMRCRDPTSLDTHTQQEDEMCWFTEQADHIGHLYTALAISAFTLIVVCILFI